MHPTLFTPRVDIGSRNSFPLPDRLAAAIFSPWMNVSASLLAKYWQRRPAGERKS